MEFRFSSAFIGMNCTITQTGGPVVYTVDTPTKFPPMTSTFARGDTGPYATVEWKGFSARLRMGGLDVDMDEWLHRVKWWHPSRKFQVKDTEFHWVDSVWLPSWIFKQALKLTPASDENHVLATITWGPLKEPILTVEQEALATVPLDIIILSGVVMLYYKKSQQGSGAGELYSYQFSRVLGELINALDVDVN
ncbi:hypothetical protein BKA62DRAFT_381247 [Auriculariales sp. MPI-PUGE-AT-0066]|nr:hypothetical protein BKA62DRAFT_381247 [Auriculariales sp. MPI-PUGE-AT-0066]